MRSIRLGENDDERGAGSVIASPGGDNDDARGKFATLEPGVIISAGW